MNHGMIIASLHCRVRESKSCSWLLGQTIRYPRNINMADGQWCTAFLTKDYPIVKDKADKVHHMQIKNLRYLKIVG